jgi:hypothetical protein
MEFFNRLGERVLRTWKERNFDEQIFHEVAVAEMRELPPSDHVSLDDVVDWVHDAPRIAPQGSLTNPFGSPPVTVYRNDRFYIEVLFWVDATTGVHQHHFSGAFHVLAGSSLHSEYAFRTEHRYSDRLKIGQLDLLKVEHLRRGDVRAIRSCDALIHSLFHLDRPTVSVVVRTEDDPFAGPQYAYARNGVAWDPFYMTDSGKKQQQTLALLHSLERPSLLDRARRTIEVADPFTAHTLLSWLAHAVEDREFVRFLDELRSPHTALVDRLRRQRDEALREQAIIDRRQRIRSPEHRFLLALLLNVPSRKRILEVVRGAYPDAPPSETVLRWVSELSETRLGDGRNALDVELGEPSLRILAHLIDGATDEQVLARLREEFDDVDSQREGVHQTCRAFRDSLIFRTLLMP